ncbi:MAG: glutaredoxin family protein [Polyangiaceae bacterium]
MRCARHPLACGPDGRCTVCAREATARGARRAALLGLALTATLIAGGAIGYRVATASLATTEVVARNFRQNPVPMQASLVGGAALPAESAPRAAPDPSREQRVQEFQDAFANAWREGLAQAATVTVEKPTAPADTPTPTASATADSIPEAAAPAATTSTSTSTPTAASDPPMLDAGPPATSDPPAAPVVAAAPAAAPPDAGDLHVVVYSASWCPSCQQAEAWMTANSIAFEERDIDSSPDFVQQLKSLNRRMTIPTFDIDGSISVGFYPGRIAWLLQRAAARRAMKGVL